MEPEFWLERWTRNEIGFHQSEINSHLTEYWPSLGVTPGRRVFVPLCGKSRDILWLMGQGLEVLAVEVSPIAVEAFFTENRLTPEVSGKGRFESWRCDGLEILLGDFFDLQTKHVRACAAVYDRASLVALPRPMRAAYARHLISLLQPAVPMLLVAMEYPQDQMPGPPFAVMEAEIRVLYEHAFRVQRLFELDIIKEAPRFADRGISSLLEKVYRLDPR